MSASEVVLEEARLLAATPLSSATETAEAFEALRERIDDDDELALFDLAVLEAKAHREARAGVAWAGDEADVLLSSLARIVAGTVVDEREREYLAALDHLRDALGDRTLDATPEVAINAWLALARGCIRVEDRDRITAALGVWHRACAAARGATLGHCALTALELASHAEDAEAAHEASEQLWRLRETDAEGVLDAEDRASLIAPVWQVRMSLGDADGARAAADALVTLCIEAARPARIADALAAVAECAIAQGDLGDARAALERRLELAESLLRDADDSAATESDMFALARRDEAREALAAVEAMIAEGAKPR